MGHLFMRYQIPVFIQALQQVLGLLTALSSCLAYSWPDFPYLCGVPLVRSMEGKQIVSRERERLEGRIWFLCPFPSQDNPQGLCYNEACIN